MKKILVLLCFPLFSSGQSTLSPLNTGDTVTGLQFEILKDDRPESTSFASLNKKLIILDFWATWCGSCISHFPEMDSIQEEIKSDFRFLLVNCKSTGDSPAKINSMFKKRKKKDGTTFNLITAVDDTIANKLFPFSTLPHYVWIKEGRLLATTDFAAITVKNIRDVLADKPVSFRQKEDLEFDISKPLFVHGNGGNGENILFRSMITGYAPGIPSGQAIDKDSNNLGTRLVMTNAPLVKLYIEAWENDLPADRIIAPTEHRIERTYKDWDNRKWDHAFCYELITPPLPMIKLKEKMKSDLESYFGFTAAIEKISVPCLIIKTLSTGPKIKTSKRKPFINSNSSDGPLVFQNQPMSMLVGFLNEFSTIPVIDETGISHTIDISFNADINDVPALREELKKFGLDVVVEEREVECFVIGKK